MPEILTPFIILLGAINLAKGLSGEDRIFNVSTGLFLLASIFLSETMTVLHPVGN